LFLYLIGCKLSIYFYFIYKYFNSNIFFNELLIWGEHVGTKMKGGKKLTFPILPYKFFDIPSHVFWPLILYKLFLTITFDLTKKVKQ